MAAAKEAFDDLHAEFSPSLPSAFTCFFFIFLEDEDRLAISQGSHQAEFPRAESSPRKKGWCRLLQGLPGRSPVGFRGCHSNSRHTSKCEPFLEGCCPSRNAVQRLHRLSNFSSTRVLSAGWTSSSLISVPSLSKPQGRDLLVAFLITPEKLATRSKFQTVLSPYPNVSSQKPSGPADMTDHRGGLPPPTPGKPASWTTAGVHSTSSLPF